VSNALAIATVSAVLRARIQGLVDAAGMSGFDVVTAAPAPDADPGVYLHLYQITPDADLRNQTMPERDADGGARRAPRLAVDLMYALTFLGAAATQDAERLAGMVLTSLNEAPRLAAEEIADYLGTLPAGHALAGSDLASQVESIRLTMAPLDLEDLARLWGMNSQAPPRLTVAYRAAVVMLDARTPSATALPVTRDPALLVFPLRRPQLAAVRSDQRPQPVVRFGETLVLTGTALRGDRTSLVVGGLVLPVADATDTELRLPVTAAVGLRPGVAGVQVRQDLVLADGSSRAGAESGQLPVALVPVLAPASPATLAGTLAGAPAVVVRLDVTPAPLPTEDLTVILNGPGGSRSQWPGVATAAGIVEASTTGLTAGTYLVRLSVGGAVSLLDVAADGTFTGPSVTLT
jgi:hypothetical protein